MASTFEILLGSGGVICEDPRATPTAMGQRTIVPQQAVRPPHDPRRSPKIRTGGAAAQSCVSPHQRVLTPWAVTTRPGRLSMRCSFCTPLGIWAPTVEALANSSYAPIFSVAGLSFILKTKWLSHFLQGFCPTIEELPSLGDGVRPLARQQSSIRLSGARGRRQSAAPIA